MEYNTKREAMAIPEYGRNIHKMIDYCVNIEDREKRTKTAHAIVNVMGQMNTPNYKGTDFEHKLWDHLHIISGFNLDVDSPFPPPNKDDVSKKPERISYSKSEMEYPHYGKHVERIIEAVTEIEDGEKKDAIVLAISNFLKKSYLNWNRDSVNDETIIKNLQEMSNGKLNLKEDYTLISSSEALAKPKKQKNIVNKKSTQTKSNKKKYKRRF
ncbi:MAG: DUF4290 domain-containing protein [Marinilabiliales bacterium]|nr:MAG: DUF4290 domain-containing protein [Marinilabiliales bacterium]